MPRLSQTTSGKGWEYALASELKEALGREASLAKCQQYNTAKTAFGRNSSEEQRKMQKAGRAVAEFLIKEDERLETATEIRFQKDAEGQIADVRDIVVQTGFTELGISAKQRNNALKHPRISLDIDIGQLWYGKNSSPNYKDQTKKVFEGIKKHSGKPWKCLNQKEEKFFKPALEAVKMEIESQNDTKKLMQYILGKQDYYKVIKKNGEVTIDSFNMLGKNKWGNKIPLPESMILLELRKGSSTFLDMVMDKGWSISFRIHNGDGKISRNPSLKLDVRPVGFPHQKSTHFIRYD